MKGRGCHEMNDENILNFDKSCVVEILPCQITNCMHVLNTTSFLVQMCGECIWDSK